jgi:predicted transcriptional regulator
MNYDVSQLSRRERQIMDILYTLGEGTVVEICEKLPKPPSTMAARRMIQILDQKGWLKRRKVSREFIYRPRQSFSRAGAAAMDHLLSTYFKGSLEEALVVFANSRRDNARTHYVNQMKAALSRSKK